MTSKTSTDRALFRTSSETGLFKSARTSTDRGLVAVVLCLLAAFALHAGAFLPRIVERERAGAIAEEIRARAPADAGVAARGVQAVPAAPNL